MFYLFGSLRFVTLAVIVVVVVVSSRVVLRSSLDCVTSTQKNLWVIVPLNGTSQEFPVPPPS
jgi:hypothetical protein